MKRTTGTEPAYVQRATVYAAEAQAIGKKLSQMTAEMNTLRARRKRLERMSTEALNDPQMELAEVLAPAAVQKLTEEQIEQRAITDAATIKADAAAGPSIEELEASLAAFKCRAPDPDTAPPFRASCKKLVMKGRFYTVTGARNHNSRGAGPAVTAYTLDRLLVPGKWQHERFKHITDLPGFHKVKPEELLLTGLEIDDEVMETWIIASGMQRQHLERPRPAAEQPKLQNVRYIREPVTPKKLPKPKTARKRGQKASETNEQQPDRGAAQAPEKRPDGQAVPPGAAAPG